MFIVTIQVLGTPIFVPVAPRPSLSYTEFTLWTHGSPFLRTEPVFVMAHVSK